MLSSARYISSVKYALAEAYEKLQRDYEQLLSEHQKVKAWLSNGKELLRIEQDDKQSILIRCSVYVVIQCNSVRGG